MKKDCCWENLNKAKWISRATWVCPKCGKDVSLEYVLLQDCLEETLTINNIKK